MPERLIEVNERSLPALLVAEDYALTADLAATPHDQRAEKESVLSELTETVRQLGLAAAADSAARALDRLQPGASLADLEKIAADLELPPGSRDATVFLIELATWTTPKGFEWSADRASTLASSAATIVAQVDPTEISELTTAHKKNLKRLRGDSVSPGAQVGLGAFMAAATVASGGIANAVGSFVGTQFMGLSGAAATSAGLAFLGGGSIAAGGFGMAGGTFLVGHAAGMGGKRLAVLLAQQSSAAVIDELAKLDLVVSRAPGTKSATLEALDEVRNDLVSAMSDLGVDGAKARRRAAAVHVILDVAKPSEVVDHLKELKDERPDREERNLAAALRAVDAEIRYLKAPEWKRAAFRVPRAVGLPAASRLIDRL